ncbi:hypothetical protein U3516DRAFT_779032 [Neocallimastix sp. 'constans']
MLFRIILAIYTCFASFLQNGYTLTISINSDEIPDELIYHFDIISIQGRTIGLPVSLLNVSDSHRIFVMLFCQLYRPFSKQEIDFKFEQSKITL